MATIDVGEKFEGSLIKNNGNKTSGVFKLVENNEGILFFREETSGQDIHIPFQAVSEVIKGGVSGVQADITVENAKKLQGNSWSGTVPDVLDDNTLVEDDVLEINLGPNLSATSDGDNGVTITRNNDHGSLDGLGDDDHPQYQTEEQTQDTVNSLLKRGSGTDLIYNDSNDTLTINTFNGDVAGEYTNSERLSYLSFNTTPNDLIIYCRLYLPQIELAEIGWFPSEDGRTGDVIFGVYSENQNKEPDSLLIETGVNSVTTTGGQVNSYSLNNSWTPPSSGHYWVARNCNVNSAEAVTIDNVNSNGQLFNFVRTEAMSVSNGLPTNATPSTSSIRLPWTGVFE